MNKAINTIGQVITTIIIFMILWNETMTFFSGIGNTILILGMIFTLVTSIWLINVIGGMKQ